jgi:hypothetical protein
MPIPRMVPVAIPQFTSCCIIRESTAQPHLALKALLPLRKTNKALTCNIRAILRMTLRISPTVRLEIFERTMCCHREI